MENTSVPRPDPERYAVMKTVCQPFPIDQLAVYVASVATHQRRVYVDRRAGSYTWSFVHDGGPYPLLREVASFLRYPHTKLVVAGRAVGDRWCVMVGADGDDKPVCDVWAVLEFTGPSTPARRLPESMTWLDPVAIKRTTGDSS